MSFRGYRLILARELERCRRKLKKLRRRLRKVLGKASRKAT